MQDLQLEVRRKGYKRRVLQRTSWHLAKGLELAVNLYALIHTAVKPGHKCVLVQDVDIWCLWALNFNEGGAWCHRLHAFAVECVCWRAWPLCGRQQQGRFVSCLGWTAAFTQDAVLPAMQQAP